MFITPSKQRKILPEIHKLTDQTEDKRYYEETQKLREDYLKLPMEWELPTGEDKKIREQSEK